ncbi:hypothetical protein [Brachybacterium sacelli]|uniref:hypothetical protein n=1 Tax=Brachybacterium sacelli TaxID=173364 RepID=UPI00361A15F3
MRRRTPTWGAPAWSSPRRRAPHHQVHLPRRHRLGALSLGEHLDAAGGGLELEVVAQLEREPERSKPGPRFAEVAGTRTETCVCWWILTGR